MKQTVKQLNLQLHLQKIPNKILSMKQTVKEGGQLLIMRMRRQKQKKRIEKKAMELLHDNLSSLKESYDEFSGGCGETLLDITMQAANANTPRVQKTNEVKLAKN